MSLWKAKFSPSFWSLKQLFCSPNPPCTQRATEANTKEIPRGVRWSQPVWMHLITPELLSSEQQSSMKSIMFIAQGASGALTNTHLPFHYTEEEEEPKFYRVSRWNRQRCEWLIAQMNSLALPSSSLLSFIKQIPRLQSPCWASQSTAEIKKTELESERAACQGKWHIHSSMASYFHRHGSLGLSREPKCPCCTVFK